MWSKVEEMFRDALPKDVEYCLLRAIESQRESLSVRNGVLQPLANGAERGVMVTVREGRGHGYAATMDLSVAGFKEAIDRARHWAQATAASSLFDASRLPKNAARLGYSSRVAQPWKKASLSSKVERLIRAEKALSSHETVVESRAGMGWQRDSVFICDSIGTRVEQEFETMAPDLCVVAHRENVTQTRSLGMIDRMRQGGLEVLDGIDFEARAEWLREEVLELLSAPNCPSGKMDLVLLPDQMILQIHESIGHPIELDRILGDERNYAGTSFVTLDMFGSYEYGSKLLNVSFDPMRDTEVASYACDDDGTPAERVFLIREGILLRPLGGATSQARAGVKGTANARASNWNRPPIDRMANLNLEPGNSTLKELIGGVENGILMKSNCSWSIDDSRNKFQFGCEWGQLIRNGELTQVVRNPNYRGISANFWRGLTGVGDASTEEVLGTPFCGKGEPNQAIRVGHASPACRFSAVDVFGGEQ